MNVKKLRLYVKPQPRLIVTAVLLLIVVALLAKLISTSAISDKKLQALADRAVAACASKGEGSSACYENTIPPYIDQISMADAFRVTGLVIEKDPNFQYCHAIAHKLSEREVRKNPNNWLAVVSECPEGVCANGCLHGVFQEHFRADSLTDAQITEVIPQLKTVCEKVPGWQPTENEKFSCYHALGHISVYLTNADFKKSVDICNQIATNANGVDRLQSCFEGIFMQLFTHIEPEDAALVQGLGINLTNFAKFCGSFDGMAKEACFRESWVLQREKLLSSQGIETFCNLVPGDRAIKACYNKMFFTVSAAMNFDTKKMSAICQGLTAPWSERCYGDSAVSPLTAEHKFSDKALAMCQEAVKAGYPDSCYQEIASFATTLYSKGSTDQVSLCQSLPQKMRLTCLGQ